jgi:hypothetical protein
MLKYIIVLIALPLLAFAQKSGAKLVFNHESADAGDIVSGQIAEHVFPFVNQGDDTLRITNVYSS